MRSSCVVVVATCGGVFAAAALGQDCGSCEVIYSNPYVGQGTFGANAQLYEDGFEAYDVWLGDDFSTSADYSDLVVRSAGWCGNGCVSPALAGFVARIYDALPDDPDAPLVMESGESCFDGVDTWSAAFGDQVLPAGDYSFAFASKNEFGSNGLMYFWAMPGEGANGWQWFSGGGWVGGLPGGGGRGAGGAERGDRGVRGGGLPCGLRRQWGPGHPGLRVLPGRVPGGVSLRRRR